MANSTIIGKIKRRLIKEMIKDESIINAIDSPDVVVPDKLIGTHIFDFNQDPNTLQKVITFITIQVHIPENRYSNDNFFVSPTIEIWIISHEKHMIVDNVPKVKENRNDYISTLLDKRLNGKYNYGIGKIVLVSNVEGSFQQDYLFRKMTFKGVDMNSSVCEDEDNNE